MIDRLFGGYPDLAYAEALHAGALPPNIKIIEFFFLAGRWLHVPFAQQHYISANYTHAASYILERGLNVIAQLVAKRVVDGVARYSLSCNTDTTLDLLRARAEGRASFRLVGQVNSELPFMPGQGDLAAEEFSAMLDSPETDFPLFAPPAEPIGDTKYAIGLHAAGLVRDGGSLQIGIGQVGDALAQGLIVRHRDNARFRDIMKRLAPATAQRAELETGPFEQGLYGVSEMLFEAFLGLMEAGILKREVDGVALHGAFFLGPKSFYRSLREMPRRATRAHPDDAGVVHQPALWRRGDKTPRPRRCAVCQQRDDGDLDGRGDLGRSRGWPGGERRRRPVQFRGAGVRACGRALDPDAGGDAADAREMESNIRWSYGHQTIPRHLRDIIVTEYGVADLRGQSDADVIAAMLAVSDSRFQSELARQAKDAGKLPKGFEIPAAHRENFPERITTALKPARDAGLLPTFPFGTDFTPVEQRLIPALQLLREAQQSPLRLPGMLWQGFTRQPDAADDECLARLGLDAPATLSERAYRALVSAALARSRVT